MQHPCQPMFFVYTRYGHQSLYFFENWKEERNRKRKESNAWIWWVLEKKKYTPQIQGITMDLLTQAFFEHPTPRPRDHAGASLNRYLSTLLSCNSIVLFLVLSSWLVCMCWCDLSFYVCCYCPFLSCFDRNYLCKAWETQTCGDSSQRENLI
jgi:hypothetical protein